VDEYEKTIFRRVNPDTDVYPDRSPADMKFGMRANP